MRRAAPAPMGTVWATSTRAERTASDGEPRSRARAIATPRFQAFRTSPGHRRVTGLPLAAAARLLRADLLVPVGCGKFSAKGAPCLN
jgi:hypothetical protein